MIAALLPPDEAGRLGALLRYGAIDDATRHAFDAIVELVSNICETPMAVVSFVEEVRQVFQARVGIEASETPRDVALCSHTILGDGLFIVGDAAKDERFSDNPLVVAGPQVRFYAGAPLITPEGYRIGALCALDQKPRELKPSQLRALSLLSAQVIALLELTISRRELVEARDQSRREASVASEARAAADRANASKSAFLANMSHEIRTPMNGVVGNLELLQDTRLTTAQRECVDTITASAEALVGMVSNVLDLSKIEAGAITLERGDVAPAKLAKEVGNLYRARASAKRIELLIKVSEDMPALLTGDEQRIRQILTNLVANGIKFTERGSVTVELGGKRREGGAFLLSGRVIDTGIGIPADRQAALFAPFVQADASTTRRFGGTGLGLSISRSLALAMGGTIGLESAEGRGSTFWFEVPLEVVVVERPQVFDAPTTRGRTFEANVLVAEDELVNQLVSRKLLERLGCQVEIVGNGEQAVRRVAEGGYTLVFMDLHMPIMDGFEAVTAIRRAEEAGAPRTTIVALTASVDVASRERITRAGVDDFITKPLRTADLVRILDRFAEDATMTSHPSVATSC